MIINSAGVIVYNRQTSSELDIQRNNTVGLLIGGYIKVISNIVEEILGSDFHFNKVEAGDFKIFFSQFRKKKGIVVIISAGGNYLLNKSIKHFTTSFPDEILKRIQSPFSLKDSELEEIDSFLKVSFPYLKLEQYIKPEE